MRIAIASLVALGLASQVDAQLSQSQLDRITTFVERRAAADSFSGVVLIAHRGRPILERAYGLANKSFASPNRIDTKFQIASITKMFTGVAVAQLVEQSKLRFTDRIEQHLPWVPAEGRGITVHQLLTHTSGLGSIWSDTYQHANHALYREVKDYRPLIDYKLQFRPGARWAYSNAGYVLLGALIEQITGVAYRDHLAQHVFGRADMKSALVSDVEVPVANRAVPYMRNNWTMPGYKGYTSAESIGLSSIMPAGGAVASAPDLLRFVNALRSGGLVGRAYVDTMTQGKITYRAGASYGYGFANEIINGKRIIFHDGGANGISTNLDIYPDLDIVAIVLSNYDPPAAPSIVRQIRSVILR